MTSEELNELERRALINAVRYYIEEVDTVTIDETFHEDCKTLKKLLKKLYLWGGVSR